MAEDYYRPETPRSQLPCLVSLLLLPSSLGCHTGLKPLPTTSLCPGPQLPSCLVFLRLKTFPSFKKVLFRASPLYFSRWIPLKCCLHSLDPSEGCPPLLCDGSRDILLLTFFSYFFVVLVFLQRIPLIFVVPVFLQGIPLIFVVLVFLYWIPLIFVVLVLL